MPRRIVCVHRGQLGDTGLWYCTFNGVWSGDTRLSNGAQSADAPSVAVVNNVLYCLHRGDNNDDRLWWSTFDPYLLSWSQDVAFNAEQRSSTAPAVANYLGELHCVYKGANDNKLWWTRFDAPTRTWSPGTALPDAQTQSQPALTTWNNILWCVFRGASDQGLWCAAYYQGQWSTPSKFPNGNETGFGPALVAGEIDGAGALLCLHSTKINAPTVPGLTQSLWWSEFQGAFVNERANWSADTEFDQGNRAFASPAGVFYGGRFYCVHRGQASLNDGAGDQSLWYCRFDGRNWAADQQFEGGNRSQAGVALAILDFL